MERECWRRARHLLPLCEEGADMPLLDTIDKRQGDEFSCGACAFSVLFRFHYPNRPLPEWGDLADPVRGIGAEALELFVRKEFPNVCVGHLDLDILRFLTRRTPVICLQRLSASTDHWVCARGVTRTRVHLQCPLEGRISFTHDEWLEQWRDAEAEGGIFTRFALAGWR